MQKTKRENSLLRDFLSDCLSVIEWYKASSVWLYSCDVYHSSTQRCGSAVSLITLVAQDGSIDCGFAVFDKDKRATIPAAYE